MGPFRLVGTLAVVPMTMLLTVSFDIESRKAYIITVYEPALDKFEPDFKTRRK